MHRQQTAVLTTKYAPATNCCVSPSATRCRCAPCHIRLAPAYIRSHPTHPTGTADAPRLSCHAPHNVLFSAHQNIPVKQHTFIYLPDHSAMHQCLQTWDPLRWRMLGLMGSAMRVRQLTRPKRPCPPLPPPHVLPLPPAGGAHSAQRVEAAARFVVGSLVAHASWIASGAQSSFVMIAHDCTSVFTRVCDVQAHIGFFCQNRWQVNGMAVYLRARRGFRCLSLPQPYWQCVQSLGTGREAIPGQLYTVAVTKSPPGQRPRKGARTAEFMMTRPLYGRRTSFKPSHTSPDIIR